MQWASAATARYNVTPGLCSVQCAGVAKWIADLQAIDLLFPLTPVHVMIYQSGVKLCFKCMWCQLSQSVICDCQFSGSQSHGSLGGFLNGPLYRYVTLRVYKRNQMGSILCTLRVMGVLGRWKRTTEFYNKWLYGVTKVCHVQTVPVTCHEALISSNFSACWRKCETH